MRSSPDVIFGATLTIGSENVVYYDQLLGVESVFLSFRMWLPFTNLLNEIFLSTSYDYGDSEDFNVICDASHDFFFLNINRAYRKTGAGDDIAEHFSVIADPIWPVSTMILWPDKILGATLATGSLKKNNKYKYTV